MCLHSFTDFFIRQIFLNVSSAGPRKSAVNKVDAAPECTKPKIWWIKRAWNTKLHARGEEGSRVTGERVLWGPIPLGHTQRCDTQLGGLFPCPEKGCGGCFPLSPQITPLFFLERSEAQKFKKDIRSWHDWLKIEKYSSRAEARRVPQLGP